MGEVDAIGPALLIAAIYGMCFRLGTPHLSNSHARSFRTYFGHADADADAEQVTSMSSFQGHFLSQSFVHSPPAENQRPWLKCSDAG
jgi:hypothetical protein